MECGNTRIELKGNALTFERALKALYAISHMWTASRPRMRHSTNQQLPSVLVTTDDRNAQTTEETH